MTERQASKKKCGSHLRLARTEEMDPICQKANKSGIEIPERTFIKVAPHVRGPCRCVPRGWESCRTALQGLCFVHQIVGDSGFLLFFVVFFAVKPPPPTLLQPTRRFAVPQLLIYPHAYTVHSQMDTGAFLGSQLVHPPSPCIIIVGAKKQISEFAIRFDTSFLSQALKSIMDLSVKSFWKERGLARKCDLGHACKTQNCICPIPTCQGGPFIKMQ